MQEASEEGAKALADAQAQLAAERGARDAAEAQLSSLQVRTAQPGLCTLDALPVQNNLVPR